MRNLSVLCLGLLFCGVMQANQDTAVVKKSWFRGDVGPMGPTGPMGPQGPKGDRGERGSRGLKGNSGSGFVAACGYASLQLSSDQSTPIQEHIDFTMPAKGSLHNVGWNDIEKKFKIEQPGVYEISYFVHCFTNATNENATSLQISVVYGGEALSTIPFISLFHPTTLQPSTADCESQGSVFVRLNTGDTVSLDLKKTNQEATSPIYWQSEGIASSLSLKRISE